MATSFPTAAPEDKAAIPRRHLVDHVPVWDLCDEYKIQSRLFHLWQRQAFEHLSAALQDGRTTRGQQAVATERARVEALGAKLAKKDGIIAFIASEHLALSKNSCGGLRARWVPSDTRDAVVDFVRTFHTRTELSTR